MNKLPSEQTGAKAEETTSWLASRDAHKGPRGPGATLDRKPRRRFGVRPRSPSRGELVRLIPFRAQCVGALVCRLSCSLRRLEAVGRARSLARGVPSAAPAHPESPRRGRAPKGSSGGRTTCPRSFSTAERLTPRADRWKKVCPGRVGSSPGLIVTCKGECERSTARGQFRRASARHFTTLLQALRKGACLAC